MVLIKPIEKKSPNLNGVVYLLTLFFLFSPFNVFAVVEAEYDFDIPAIGAAVAIKAISRQTESSAFFQSVDVENVQVNPLKGRYTIQQALDVIFEGTLLSGALTENGVITISRKEIKSQQPESKKSFVTTVLDFFRGDSAQQIGRAHV